MKRMNKKNKSTANYLYMGIPPSEQVSGGSFLVSYYTANPHKCKYFFGLITYYFENPDKQPG